jgi:cation:H+ antiporter
MEGDQNPCSLALANMTGANRLLIGIGWSLVVLVAWFRFRGQGRPTGGVGLPRSSAVEVTYLSLATLYSLSLPLKRTITLVDLVVLVAIFVAYTLRIAKARRRSRTWSAPRRGWAPWRPGDGGPPTCRSSGSRRW